MFLPNGWSYEQSVDGGNDGEYAWPQQHELSLTMADWAIASAECQIHQQWRPTLSPRYGTIPQVDQQKI